MIIMIIVGAKIFGYFFTLTQVTQEIVHVGRRAATSRAG